MNGIYTLCTTPEAADQAFDELQACGISDRDITVVSSQPYEHYRFGQQDAETQIQWVSVAGGAAGFTGAVTLVTLVQASWPLQTGGMPWFPVLPNLIPIFEMTMLGSVLATVAALCVTARLLRRVSGLYDPAVSDGKILVGVAKPQPDKLPAIERVLGTHGELKRAVD